MANISSCAFCGSFALQSLTPSGKYELHCFNEFDKDCDETGPACNTSRESIDGWNAQQAKHRASQGERDE
jgi:hypothetical protein